MADGKNPPQSDPHAGPSADERRQFLAASVAAGAVGAVLTLFPLGAGALILVDPLRKKRATGGEHGGSFIRVASIDSVPEDGTPVQIPVIADLTDAWNREPNQPVGAVYLLRQGDQVKCFNAICPHAGCFVGYAEERKIFQCPCHTSAFELDGSIIAPSPSPRAMDELEVDQEQLKKTGDVMIRFLNYLPGHADQVAK